MNLLLNVLIVLAVALSGLLVPDRVASGANEASVAAPAGANPAMAAYQLDLGRVGSWLDVCTGAQSILLTDSELCTHGPDPAPPGFDVDEQVQPLLDHVARQQMAGIACDGDGQSGFRVQVLYVHGSDVDSRNDRFRLSIQGWAGAMDQIFQASAAETGGVRDVRFVHDANCQPIVEAVEVSPAGDGNFGATIAELRNQRYNRTDRVYLAFVDTTVASARSGTMTGPVAVSTGTTSDRAIRASTRDAGAETSRPTR